MSMYNMLFGVERTAGAVLELLGKTSNDVPRFRDAYLTWADDAKTDPVMVIHTRTGGGNRDYYDSEARRRAESPEDFTEGTPPPTGPWNADLRGWPGYRYDVDDDFDSTYADFYFDVPASARDAVVGFLQENGQPATPREKFDALMAAMKAATP